MTKTYEERMKEQGYTDEMLALDRRMEEIATKRLRVRLTDNDGREYVGKARTYCKADDEEDGFSTVCIDTDDDGGWCLGVNEIRSIEEV